MRLIARLVFAFFSSVIALFAAAYFVSGFVIEPTSQSYAIAAALLGALYVFIRPILRALMTPLIWLTLGIAIILVNMILLKLLDFLSPQITINGLLPLFWSALTIGIVNFLVSSAAEGTYKSG